MSPNTSFLPKVPEWERMEGTLKGGQQRSNNYKEVPPTKRKQMGVVKAINQSGRLEKEGFAMTTKGGVPSKTHKSMN